MGAPDISAFRTPHKIGRLVVAPSYRKGDFDSHAVDCPFPFLHEGKYYMTYVGWDRTGYRTGLASSTDLETWRKKGLILDRGPERSVTQYNAALTCILRDNELFGTATLKKVGGRFVGTYHAYPKPGYEEGPPSSACAIPTTWKSARRFSARPACAWEAGGLYKSWLMEADGTYCLFYNAKNNQPGGWIEQTGVATSRDLKTWERSPLNPILPNGNPGEFDDLSASDPVVLRHGDKWVMYYFGNGSDGHARDSVAFSTDLLHWQKERRGAHRRRTARQHRCPARPQARHDRPRRKALSTFTARSVRQPIARIGDVIIDESRGITFASSSPPS